MPREDIVLETTPLGQGSFGNVYRGVLRTGLEKRIEIKVAVKVRFTLHLLIIFCEVIKPKLEQTKSFIF